LRSLLFNLTAMTKKIKLLKPLLFITAAILLLTKTEISLAQDTTRIDQPYLFFPYPLGEKKWHVSLGFTLTAMPEDVTEEVQVRAPVLDLHAVRKLSKSFYLDGRLQTQFVQGHISVGVRWAHIINERLSLSVGDDIAWWHGKLEVASFDTKANGWQNFPNASLGLRFKDKILMTVKGEALLNLGYTTSIAEDISQTKGFEFSGWAGSIFLEQPLGKKSHIITGFRAQYTNFFWQTWSLFETFDRRIFYPEVIVGFVL
jgi:hypothetical protein